MAGVSFTGLFWITVVAFAAPLFLGFFPGLRFPSAVLELIVGIVIGPSVLGWAHVDVPVRVLSLVGLASLLFLAVSRSSSIGCTGPWCARPVPRSWLRWGSR